MLEPYNSGALYSRRISWSCRLFVQLEISRILQDVASGFFPIDLIIREMSAVNRSCSSEAVADFQPIDETLDLRGPPLAVSCLISSAPSRILNMYESPLAFSVPGTRLTSSRNRKERNTAQKRQDDVTSRGEAMSSQPASV